MSRRKIVFFDICGTITRTNNTLCFISFILQKTSAIKYYVFQLLVLIDVVYNASKLRKLFKCDILRMGAIRLLSGCAVSEVAGRAKEYLADLVEKGLFNNEILSIIKEDMLGGSRVILLSACIDPPVAVIADKLGIKEYYCSELETRSGYYTGRLKKDLLGDKGAVLTTIEDFKKDCSVFYTDNHEDVALHNQFDQIIFLTKENDNNRTLTCDSGNVQSLHIGSGETKLVHGDINSINRTNHLLAYIPTFYYILSRLHVKKTVALILRNIIPIWLIVHFYGHIGLGKSLVMVSLSFITFYSIYEIGGLFNDINAKNERSKNPTLRIADNVRINFGLFVAMRIAVCAAYLYYLKMAGYPFIPFASMLLLCLATYIVHTKIDIKLRVTTFTLLQVFCLLTPLVPFCDIIPYMAVFAIYFIILIPKRIYGYIVKREEIKNVFTNHWINILYYAVVILLGATAYHVTSFPVYIVLPLYLLITDSLLVVVTKYSEASAFYNLRQGITRVFS